MLSSKLVVLIMLDREDHPLSHLLLVLCYIILLKNVVNAIQTLLSFTIVLGL